MYGDVAWELLAVSFLEVGWYRKSFAFPVKRAGTGSRDQAALVVLALSVTCLLRHKNPETRTVWSSSQYGPHTGITWCDCSPTLGFFVCRVCSGDANIPPRTTPASCKALLSYGDSLGFPRGRSSLLAGSNSPEANGYLAGERCCCVFRCNCYLTNPCKT